MLSAQAQEKPAQKGTSFTLYVALQDFNATNGGTHFVLCCVEINQHERDVKF